MIYALIIVCIWLCRALYIIRNLTREQGYVKRGKKYYPNPARFLRTAIPGHKILIDLPDTSLSVTRATVAENNIEKQYIILMIRYDNAEMKIIKVPYSHPCFDNYVILNVIPSRTDKVEVIETTSLPEIEQMVNDLESQVKDVLKRFQDKSTSQANNLEEQLKKALEMEDYREAARIKRQIDSR